jgi:hypothetical protein
MIDFIPSGPIAAALAASFLIPVTLIISQWTSWRPQLGRRYRLALAVAWTGWVIMFTIAGSFDPWDCVAGGLIMLTATMISFNIWGLLAWGFMLSMLMAAHRQQKPLSRDQWIAAQSGATYHLFSRNRLTILTNMNLVREEEGMVGITPGMGRMMARIGLLASAWYGIRRIP